MFASFGIFGIYLKCTLIYSSSRITVGGEHSYSLMGGTPRRRKAKRPLGRAPYYISKGTLYGIGASIIYILNKEFVMSLVADTSFGTATHKTQSITIIINRQILK